MAETGTDVDGGVRPRRRGRGMGCGRWRLPSRSSAPIATCAAETTPAWLDEYRAPAARLIGEATGDSFAWHRLSALTDTIGPRLSGSPQLDQAIQWAVAEMKRDGLENVHTEKVMVPEVGARDRERRYRLARSPAACDARPRWQRRHASGWHRGRRCCSSNLRRARCAAPRCARPHRPVQRCRSPTTRRHRGIDGAARRARRGSAPSAMLDPLGRPGRAATSPYRRARSTRLTRRRIPAAAHQQRGRRPLCSA